MRGPFPGMDPYLEDLAGWPDFHHRLNTAISDALAAQTAPDYFVRIEQRGYITTPEESLRQAIAPYVYIVQSPQPSGLASTVATISAPTLIEPLYDREIRDQYIEILDAQGREIVTTLEVLSPANKAAGSPGRSQFLRKREAVFKSPTHWIEIDLLRAGERPTEVAGRSDYYTPLRRHGSWPYEVWYSDLRDTLPTIAVPLRDPHPQVPLDLGAVLADVYARAYYALSVDYTRPIPAPPLRPADAAWVASRLRAWRKDGQAEVEG